MANLDVVLARICNMSQEGLGKGIKEQPHSALRRGPSLTPPTSLEYVLSRQSLKLEFVFD